MSRLIAAYDRALSRSRLLTTTITGAVLGAAGDAATQAAGGPQQAQLSPSKEGMPSASFAATPAKPSFTPSVSPVRAREIVLLPEWFDLRRAFSFTCFGAVVTGPVNYLWLSRLERVVRHIAPNGGLRALATKVALQSSIMQPVIYLPLFYGFNAALRGWQLPDLVHKVRNEYWSTLQTLWLFWTPSVVFAFGVLPVRQQAVFFAGIGFAWNALLSFVSNRGSQRAGRSDETPLLAASVDPLAASVQSA